jgi:hypothetical protein
MLSVTAGRKLESTSVMLQQMGPIDVACPFGVIQFQC